MTLIKSQRGNILLLETEDFQNGFDITEEFIKLLILPETLQHIFLSNEKITELRNKNILTKETKITFI